MYSDYSSSSSQSKPSRGNTMFTITTTAGHVLGTCKGSRWDAGATFNALNSLGGGSIAGVDLSHANLEGGLFTNKDSDYSYSRMAGATIKDATGSRFAGNVTANFTGDCNSMDFTHACMYGCFITSASGMWDGGFTKGGMRVIYYMRHDLWVNVSLLPEGSYTRALLSAPLASLEDAVADLEQAQRIDVLAHVALTLSRNIAHSVTANKVNTTGDLAALDYMLNTSVNPIAEKSKDQAPPVAVKSPAKVAPKIEPKPAPAPLASVADLPADIVGQLEAEMANITKLAAAPKNNGA
jgi:hypothetical protein